MVTTTVTAPRTSLEQTPSTVPTSVIVGSLLLAASGVPLVAGFPRDGVPAGATLPLVAWLALGVASVVLLDRRPRSPIAWACVAAAATPAVITGAGFLWSGGEPGEPRMVRFAAEWGPLTLVGLAVPALAAMMAPDPSRGDRRWRVWTVASCVGAFGAACLTWFAATPEAYGFVAAAGIGAVALVVAASGFNTEPRPVVEPLVDMSLALAGIAVSAGAGGVILSIARHEQIFGAEALGAFATAATLALTIPAVWWLRREFLSRRYGTGVLAAGEVAALTADLKTAADPRAIMAKAAAMVTATSGVKDTRLVLDEVSAPGGWECWPLLVGDELVGTMLLYPSHPGGLEARQTRVCRQLLPTVGLVARAVALAIDADYARHDVAHQRDLERARILADLHDDLGPVLAGMSMRVQAAREAHGLPELDDLAVDLATCRADLRRIVSGLIPTALNDGGLQAAITRLVESFNGGSGYRSGNARDTRIILTTSVPDHIDSRSSVLIYRAVAEGITNAIKHAQATQVSISIEVGTDDLRVSVTDNGASGTGGPIAGSVVPGVGLQSLHNRAAELGGTLSIVPVLPTGTRLLLTIPSRVQPADSPGRER